MHLFFVFASPQRLRQNASLELHGRKRISIHLAAQAFRARVLHIPIAKISTKRMHYDIKEKIGAAYDMPLSNPEFRYTFHNTL